MKNHRSRCSSSALAARTRSIASDLATHAVHAQLSHVAPGPSGGRHQPRRARQRRLQRRHLRFPRRRAGQVLRLRRHQPRRAHDPGHSRRRLPRRHRAFSRARVRHQLANARLRSRSQLRRQYCPLLARRRFSRPSRATRTTSPAPFPPQSPTSKSRRRHSSPCRSKTRSPSRSTPRGSASNYCALT